MAIMEPLRKNKIGQAPALPKSLSNKWVNFIASQCGARIALVLSFPGNFCLRCSEALTLKREVYVRKCHVGWEHPSKALMLIEEKKQHLLQSSLRDRGSLSTQMVLDPRELICFEDMIGPYACFLGCL